MEDTTIEDVLKTVQNYYAQKDYQSALDTLVKHQNQISPGVWHYNLGTIYGKLENWPMARYHFLMANSEGFTSKEAVSNIELVEAKLDLQKIENPINFSDYFIKYAEVATNGIFTTIALLLIIGGIVTLWKKTTVKVTLVFLMLAFITFGLNWWTLSLDRHIVVKPSNIYEGPSVIFPSSGDLPEGLVIVTKSSGEWLKIIYPARFTGWIKNSGLKELK